MQLTHVFCIFLLLCLPSKTYQQQIEEHLDHFQETIDNSECDMVVDGPICLFNGQKIIVPDAVPPGLIGHWTFDDKKFLDFSGNKNHALNTVPVGAQRFGHGYSAMFNGENYVEIGHSDSLNVKEFSITFWIFLIQGRGQAPGDNLIKREQFCPIFQKGMDDKIAKTYYRSPALFLSGDGSLQIVVSTTESAKHPEGEKTISNARIPQGRWTHLTIVRSEYKIKLYVNGILDSIQPTDGFTMHNEHNLYLGGTPWHKGDCSVPMLLDEFRWYDKVLHEAEIQAEAYQALGVIEPSFIQLGCVNCLLEKASKSCIEKYHLCTAIELHTGGYQVARAQGWITRNSNLWSHGALIALQNGQISQDDHTLGLGLCCVDLT